MKNISLGELFTIDGGLYIAGKPNTPSECDIYGIVVAPIHIL